MTRAGVSLVVGMAGRNLSRHRAKTVITAVAVAVSVALYIFADSWLYGMNLDSRRNIVSYETGAAKIQSDAYYAKKDDLPTHEAFSGWEEIAGRLEAAGYRVAPRFVFSGTVYSNSASAPMVINAVDVVRDRELLRYADYVESGRFPAARTREIAIGAMVAERLHVGIPQRPTVDEFAAEILSAARDSGEEAFIRGLYEPYRPHITGNAFRNPREDTRAAENRLSLRATVDKRDLERLWEMLSATGRMGVRISTSIDIKHLPGRIPAGKADTDILPGFDPGERASFFSVYRLDDGDYRRVSGDFTEGESSPDELRVLAALLRLDYPGAVRHVNQLVDALVVGVINSPNPMLNGNVGTMPIDGLSDEAGLMIEGKVTELLVRSARADDSRLPGKDESAGAIAAAAGPLPEGLSVRGWEAYAESYLTAARGDQVSSRVMIFLLFLLSFLGIANTMLMAILERTREIGMLRALGMTDSQLLVAYAVEAALVGLIGSAVGVLIGCAINVPMVKYGIDYSSMTKALNGDIGYRVAASFRSAWNVPSIVVTFIGATVLSGCMAIAPALRALRMPVTESLRFE